MIEQDTIRLLRECDAGVRMGIASIEDVEKHAKGEGMKQILADCKETHEMLAQDLEKELSRFGDEGEKSQSDREGNVLDENRIQACYVREGFHDRGSDGGRREHGSEIAFALSE
jgi:hypothetical protein